MKIKGDGLMPSLARVSSKREMRRRRLTAVVRYQWETNDRVAASYIHVGPGRGHGAVSSAHVVAGTGSMRGHSSLPISQPNSLPAAKQPSPSPPIRSWT